MKVYDEEETVKRARPSALATAARAAETDDAPDISVFLPVLNEEPNLRPLHEKMSAALTALGRSAEVIYVDDGSTD
ncbi:MAG TPA: hypothetical protein VE821_00995, partial [Pyrinomonadaceae bacterium]|nr:hypothetical protein [Pyrinomonadaceae bacterium]